jgi:hypothetical protein
MMRYVNATKLMALFYTIFMKRQAVKYLYTVGVGRHSNEEIQEMVVKDLKQFSEILGLYTAQYRNFCGALCWSMLKLVTRVTSHYL